MISPTCSTDMDLESWWLSVYRARIEPVITLESHCGNSVVMGQNLLTSELPPGVSIGKILAPIALSVAWDVKLLVLC